MIRIAIVEDQAEDFHVLESYIRQYGAENYVLVEILHFANGLNFLDEYTPDFDVVFMDLEMPHIDGIDTSSVDQYEQIKGAIWCPGTGNSGFNALGRILSGEVNPSAKTADTFVTDLTADPSWNNFGDFQYDNMNEL